MALHDIEGVLSEVRSGDESRAEAAVAGLAGAGSSGHAALIRLAQSPEVDDRWWAVRGLAASALTRAHDLVGFLSDAKPEVRAAAALALCSHPAESSVPALISALSDADGIVADLAGRALASIGSAAVEPLLQFLPHATPRERVSSLRALAEIADHKAIPAFLAAASDDTALAQYWAREGLQRLGLDMVFVKP